MTDKQPEALRLADEMENYWNERGPDAEAVAAELRRLHKENERLKTVPMKYRRMEFNAQLQTENDRLRAQRDELLEVLKEMLSLWEEDPAYGHGIADRAYAVIAKVKGENT